MSSGPRPPLARQPATPLRKTISRDTSNLTPAEAALRGRSSISSSSDAVTVTGELDAKRYGQALLSRRLVGVRGAGDNYDGNYYVKQVTHKIALGEYTQSFTLTREGRGASVPIRGTFDRLGKGESVNGQGSLFYGKYRGIVTNNNDITFPGRIRARVPDVFGDDESGWAMPSAAFSGKSVGFFALPTVGAGVWIEFEHGDPDYPVWSGGWWGSSAEMPAALTTPNKQVLIHTDAGHKILIDDTPGTGGITLQIGTQGPKIVLNDYGIEIDNGKGASIKLTGAQVSINGGALEVT